MTITTSPLPYNLLPLSLSPPSISDPALATQPITLSPNPTTLAQSPQESSFAFDLSHNLVSTSSSITPLGFLPPTCASYALPALPDGTSECPPTFGSPPRSYGDVISASAGAMTAYNIIFDDCDSPFTVCLCHAANMPLDTIVDRYSRVPVGLRRYVGTVLVLPGDEARAYTLKSGDIHLFGDSGVNIWVHESMHAYDFAQNPDNPLSGSQAWQDAISADGCVPDDYSTTNPVEDFAQLGVIKMYTLANQGSLPEGMQEGCMSNQLNFMDNLPLFSDPTVLFGNTCNIQSQGENGARHDTAPQSLNMTSKMPLPDSASGNIASAPTGTQSKSNGATGIVTSRPKSLSLAATLIAFGVLLVLSNAALS